MLIPAQKREFPQLKSLPASNEVELKYDGSVLSPTDSFPSGHSFEGFYFSSQRLMAIENMKTSEVSFCEIPPPEKKHLALIPFQGKLHDTGVGGGDLLYPLFFSFSACTPKNII